MKSFHFDLSALWRIIPKILTLICCVLLVTLGIDLVQYRNKPQPVLSAKTELAMKSLNKPNTKPSHDLFGTYIPANFKGLHIQQSLLDVRVVGILYSVNEQQSEVLLRAGSGDEKVYHVGDDIPGDALIKKIEPHSIVILSHGKLERIQLPKNPLKFEKQSRLIFKE